MTMTVLQLYALDLGGLNTPAQTPLLTLSRSLLLQNSI